jgi:hypothetical protein
MYNPIIPYANYTQFTPALPEFYWNVYSAEQRWKHLCMELHKLVAYADNLGVQLNLTHEEVENLQAQFQKFLDGEMQEFYEKQILAWIDANMERLIKHSIEHVYFGLTDDGYFCAYIPESWSDITFDTGAVFGRSDYGRLILKMNVDSQNAIDNTYSYSLNAEPTEIQSIIRDLESTTRRGDASYDALFTNMNEEVPNGNF